MEQQAKIYVAGHRGLVGSALMRCLRAEGYSNVLVRTHADLDLCNQAAVNKFFSVERPDYVFLSAAKVGGIHANSTYPADFIYDNLCIGTNVIDAAYRHGVKKLMFLGSSCIYPKLAPQPIPEEALLSSALEPTNEWYAIAKIAGIKLCQAYRRQYGFNAISAMPTNLYGPNDNFHPLNSHVLPAMLQRFHNARVNGDTSVTVWGTGKVQREFMHADDLADALVFIMRNYEGEEHINVGSSDEVTISELAMIIADTVGYTGEIIQDTTKQDGAPRKLVDSTRLRQLGWNPKISLHEGIADAYQWYLKNIASN